MRKIIRYEIVSEYALSRTTIRAHRMKHTITDKCIHATSFTTDICATDKGTRVLAYFDRALFHSNIMLKYVIPLRYQAIFSAMSAVGNGNTASAALNSAHQAQYCGPYKLEKTLGKGQTGTPYRNLVSFFLKSHKSLSHPLKPTFISRYFDL
uniref:Protein kinase domain-containing protein n=1 Tax=Parascaris univalens TaxID=6257 RepID=A0A915A4F9_PARUN